MANRIKPTSFRTYADFTDAIDDVARKQVELTKLKARRDSRIQTVEAEFKDEIERIEGEISELVVLAEKYAVVHRNELFPGDTKTGSSASANFGFRLGNPTLKTLNRKWSPSRCVSRIAPSSVPGAHRCRSPSRTRLGLMPASIITTRRVSAPNDTTVALPLDPLASIVSVSAAPSMAG